MLPSGISYVGEALISPRQVARILIAERRGLIFGFFVVLIFSIVEGMVATLTFISRLGLYIPIPTPIVGIVLGRITLLFGTVAYVVICMCYWVLGGLIIHAFCKLFGGRGSFEHTLTAFSFLWIPTFIEGLLSLLILVLDYVSGIGLFLLLFFASLVWGLIMSIQALSEVHGFGAGKALLSMIIPVIIIIVVLLVSSIIIGIRISCTSVLALLTNVRW